MSRTEVSHFWVGRFLEPDFSNYFTEVWNEEDEELEHTPLSAFAADQGEKWYDHDFLEYGVKTDCATIEELVAGYSYSDQWGTELARRVAEAGLKNVNAFVFISQGEIENPCPKETQSYWLRYMGTIEYEI